jgi:hypothetical protein
MSLNQLMRSFRGVSEIILNLKKYRKLAVNVQIIETIEVKLHIAPLFVCYCVKYFTLLYRS